MTVGALIVAFFLVYSIFLGVLDSPLWFCFSGILFGMCVVAFVTGWGSKESDGDSLTIGDISANRKHNESLENFGELIKDLPIEHVMYPMAPTSSKHDRGTPWIRTNEWKTSYYRPINESDRDRLIKALRKDGKL